MTDMDDCTEFLELVAESCKAQLTGRPGRDGEDGRPGRDGEDGRDGRDGYDGRPGRDGEDGRDGRDGRDGAKGEPGGVPYLDSNMIEQNGKRIAELRVKPIEGHEDTTVSLAIRPREGDTATWFQLGTDGIKRGIGSVDLQMGRDDNSQVASSDYSAIGGGFGNATIGDGEGSVIGGGRHNTIEVLDDGDGRSAIGGGRDNLVRGSYSTIIGGRNNIIKASNNHDGGSSDYCTIGGGRDNRIVGSGEESDGRYYGTIVGGRGNYLETWAECALIGGGYNNRVASAHASIGGGRENYIGAANEHACIPGGEGLIANDRNQVVLGRWNKIVQGALVVGAGTDHNNRHNIMVLDHDGNLYLAGDFNQTTYE